MEQNQNRNFHRHIFNLIFLLTRHSKVLQIMSWNWPTAKCRRRKFCDTSYYIICAKLRVSFSSKLKATNVFPKHILKGKARDKLIRARKKLLYHVIVKTYLCNVLCKFLTNFEITWRNEWTNTPFDFTVLWKDCQKQPPEVFYKKSCFFYFFWYQQERTVMNSLFKKVADLKACNFNKTRPYYRCFPVNIAKFLRPLILKNIYEQ